MHTGRRVGAVLVVLALVSALGVGAAAAHDGTSIEVKKPWARVSAMEASNGAVYMVLKNESSSDQSLVGVSVPTSVAAEAQMHETVTASGDPSATTMAGGMGSSATTMAGASGTMTMRQVDEIMIPAESTVRLEPGGYHIMLMDLAAPLKAGSSVKVTLEFEGGKTMTVKAVVKK